MFFEKMSQLNYASAIHVGRPSFLFGSINQLTYINSA